MPTSQNIIDNASYHAGLLSSIAELDYIPSAIKQQVAYIRDLETQCSRCKKRVEELSEKTNKERKEHHSLRDSTTRRLAHKLTGRKEKFEAKESKEEREYVEALEKEVSERNSQTTLEQMLSEAKQLQEDLSEKSKLYDSFKRQLASLYSVVFDGPTEEFPEDDTLEYELDAAQRRHDQVQTTLNCESQAADILTRADQIMNLCQGKMQEALGYSQWDMWGGGGMSDMMERNALSMAQSYASQVTMLARQAQNISPLVRPLGPLNIAQGSIISDVFFDNIFTDMAFHNKIRASAAQLNDVYRRLRVERDTAGHRAEIAGADVIRAADALELCRSKLNTFRRETFDRISGPALQQNGAFNRPPSYDTAAAASEPEQAPPAASSSPAPAYTPQSWGNRNPYAAAMVERTRITTLSQTSI